MTETFAQTVEQFRQDFQTLLTLVESYPIDKREQEGVSGWWSPRQVLDHFSGWMVEAERRYDMFDAGIPGNMTYHVNSFNATSIAHRAGHSWTQSVTELRQHVDELVRRARQVPPTKAARDPRYAEWLESMAKDSKHHLAELRAFLHTAQAKGS